MCMVQQVALCSCCTTYFMVKRALLRCSGGFPRARRFDLHEVIAALPPLACRDLVI